MYVNEVMMNIDWRGPYLSVSGNAKLEAVAAMKATRAAVTKVRIIMTSNWW